METEEKGGKGDRRRGKGSLYIVGIGPGGTDDLTGRARDALSRSECIVGYTRYVGLLSPLVEGKEVHTTGMTREVERCAKALELAREGKTVAIVSSGDAGIYGMAGLILQLATEDTDITIETIPGVPAFVAAASMLGAPLMHDFASISLSDLLTPREKIVERVEAAARADFVIIFYNPKSTKRTEGLPEAVEIVRRFRKADTPAGIVRNASRKEEECVLTTLGEIDRYYDRVDMLSLVIIGNSTTFKKGEWMITPRGYKDLGEPF